MPPPTELVRIARNLYVPVEERDNLTTLCTIALESSAPDSIIVSTTAARLHDLWLPPLAFELHIATAVLARAGRTMTRTRRRQIRAHRLQLAEDERTMIDGIPVTTLGRTWLDLADVLDLPGLVAAGDRALQIGATRDELAHALARRGSFRGSRRARLALPLLNPRSRSRPESHLRVAVSVPDLPHFAVNEPVYRAGGGRLAEPDLSLHEARLALEYQGANHAEKNRMRKDLTRFADLRREKWLCLPYGPAETFARPWQITAEVRAAVRDRAPHLLRPRPARRVVR
jgi:hypothetical protein